MPRRTKPPAAKKTTFRTPVWPERACRDLVAGEFANHSCDVVEGHHGPHASVSVPESIQQRIRWETANPGKIEPGGRDPFIEAV